MFSFPKVTLEAFHTVEFNYNGKQSKPHVHYIVAGVKTRERNSLLSMVITMLLWIEFVLINSTSVFYFATATYSRNLLTVSQSPKVWSETING